MKRARYNKNEVLLCAILCLLYFFLPLLLQINLIIRGWANVCSDGVPGVISWSYIAKSIMIQDIPFWTPYLAGGMPFVGIIPSAYYPLTWICGLLPKNIMLYIYYSIHYCIGGIYMYLYVSKLGCRKLVAIVTSFLFILVPHMGSHRREHTELIVSALYMSAVFYYLECYVQTQRLRNLLIAAVVMALQFYGGFLQYNVYMDIVAGLYVITGYFRNRGRVIKIFRDVIAWVGVYIVLSFASVLPMGYFLKNIQTNNSESISYQYFTSLSLHPIKLLVIIFPEIFGDCYDSLVKINYSSGMDEEISYGVVALIMIIFAVLFIRRKWAVTFMTFTGIGAFLFACMGNVPIIGHFFYYVPIINSFRVPSRSLFIFTFCILILLAMAFDEAFEIEQLEKKLALISGVIFCIMTAVMIYYYHGGWSLTKQEPIEKIFLRSYVFLLAFLLGLGCLYIVSKKWFKSYCRETFVVYCSILTIIWMMPYYIDSNYSKITDEMNFDEEIFDKETYKVIFCNLAGENDGGTGLNKQLSKRLLTLNSYTSFNLSGLYKYIYHTNIVPVNQSGMYLRCFGDIDILLNNKDFFSMMGVKYISTPSMYRYWKGITSSKDYEIIDCEDIIQTDNVEFLMGEDYYIWTKPVEIEADSYYEIEVDVKEGAEGSFYVDFYSNDYYDTSLINYFDVSVENRNPHYTALIHTEEFNGTNSFFRIVSFLDEKDGLKSVSLRKVNVKEKPIYSKIFSNNKYFLFENSDAKELVFPSKTVEKLYDCDDLYINTANYDIGNTSYIEDIDYNCDYSKAEAKVSDIQISNNKVSAKVVTKDDTFINMSQSYYPGWCGYIDGEKTQIYKVNGIIQGMFVSKGTHIIEFRFEPIITYLSIAITLIMFSIVCIYIYVDIKKDRCDKNGNAR